ncbi:MAG TPA: aldo/keto reductase, partial [Ramlibacter sp.]|nr:aldo/keto reductase [Ramlibacter sp.]
MAEDLQARVTAIGLTPKSNGMQYRHVGKSGLIASAIGIGCFPFGGYVKQPDVQAVVDQALELGINYFDTANSYGIGKSEEALGLALQGSKRQQALIATKFGNRTGDGPNEIGNSRMATINACEASLKRLKTDYIDL